MRSQADIPPLLLVLSPARFHEGSSGVQASGDRSLRCYLRSSQELSWNRNDTCIHISDFTDITGSSKINNTHAMPSRPKPECQIKRCLHCIFSQQKKKCICVIVLMSSDRVCTAASHLPHLGIPRGCRFCWGVFDIDGRRPSMLLSPFVLEIKGTRDEYIRSARQRALENPVTWSPVLVHFLTASTSASQLAQGPVPGHSFPESTIKLQSATGSIALARFVGTVHIYQGQPTTRTD